MRVQLATLSFAFLFPLSLSLSNDVTTRARVRHAALEANGPNVRTPAQEPLHFYLLDVACPRPVLGTSGVSFCRRIFCSKPFSGLLPASRRRFPHQDPVHVQAARVSRDAGLRREPQQLRPIVACCWTVACIAAWLGLDWLGLDRLGLAGLAVRRMHPPRSAVQQPAARAPPSPRWKIHSGP